MMTPTRRRVAITGLGAVTPVGNDAPSTWAALVAGKSGIGPITTFDASTFPVRIAGTVKDFAVADALPPEARHLTRHLSRAAGFGLAATAQALADAGIAPDTYAPEERGVAIGASVGRPELQELADILYRRHSTDEREVERQAPASVLARDQTIGVAALALLGDCQGPMLSVSTACSGSAHALGEAFRRVQDGEARMMIAGGYDALNTYLDVLGFALLGALTRDYNDDPTHASRPFDKERSGFVLGEGGVVAILEDWESAEARGARILAELAGYASSMNAYRITDAPPDGGGATLAIANAIKDAGMQPADIDYIVAHGTSTPGNDLCETMAIKNTFGDDAYRLAVSSPKSMVGHLTSGAGGLNLLAAVYAMREGVVPPTINYEHPDPKLDLNYVPNEAQARPVRAAVVDAFAFGGTNASLVVKRSDER
ncbi:MAG TPA: beta-ketoacyl-[acyl-carrier-protein] synthase family protein [Thermomicrobiales bacterium]|nr:beta-ketoacyl-[acyl-carrier-protein] synthase family protein [Thermomicrobiales bacterium]